MLRRPLRAHTTTQTGGQDERDDRQDERYRPVLVSPGQVASEKAAYGLPELQPDRSDERPDETEHRGADRADEDDRCRLAQRGALGDRETLRRFITVLTEATRDMPPGSTTDEPAAGDSP